MKDVPSVICMCQYGTCIATVNLRILKFVYCKCKICVLCRAGSPEKKICSVFVAKEPDVQPCG